MERLTHLDGDGYPVVENDMCYEDQCERYCGPAIDRLSDYEDSGLEPEEIKSLQAEWKASLEALEYYRDAETDGRLVILPCKTGDCLWDTEDLTEEPSVHVVLGFDILRSLNMMHLSNGKSLPVSDFGKTIFRTKEEAVHKMEEEEDERVD